MGNWQWLETYTHRWPMLARVVIKAVGLFILANIVYALIGTPPTFGIYNGLVPGRERLPYGEDPAAYNLSLNNLPAMFNSHVIVTDKADDEFRVVVMGDSGVWGILLEPHQTLTGQLNQQAIVYEGLQVRAYNLGHPILSVTKDLMLLELALDYEPDMVIWLITLESLALNTQLEPPLVQQNAARVRELINRYDLPLDAATLPNEPSFMERTIIGQRRPLADWLRLQLYGVSWVTTGIDQVYPDYIPRSNDFDDDLTWQNYTEPTTLTRDDLAFDVLAAGQQMVGDVPLVIVNEPIFIADGENSDLRYNFWYPRWAYDAYRDLFVQEADAQGWQFVDLWDVIPMAEFTDSPVHLSPAGSAQLAAAIRAAIFAVQ